MKSFCKSRFPHKSVNSSFIITDIKNKLTDLCGNRLLHNNFINSLYEISSKFSVVGPGLRIEGLWLVVSLGFKVWGLGSTVWDLEFRVWVVGVELLGFGFWFRI